MTIPIIEQQLQKAAKLFTSYCSTLPDNAFFHQPSDKWSPAQQVRHLITATNTARVAFVLPKFIVRWIGGKPNRPSRTYDELVAKYKSKLQQGGKAQGRYIPKPIPASYGKDRLLKSFATSMQLIAMTIQRNWNDDQLDKYIVPHPLLGKITLRELCYFTIYHTEHHLNSIRTITIPG
jgi:hypothetical protein